MKYFSKALHSVSKRVITLTCAFALLLPCMLCGCSRDEQDYEYEEVHNEYLAQDCYEMEQYYKNLEREPLSPDTLSLPVSFTQEQRDSFSLLVDSISVDYPYSEYFGIDSCLERYNALPPYTIIHESIFVDGVVSEKALFDAVKINNKKKGFNEQNEVTDEQILEICKYICEVVNEYVSENPDTDLNFLSQKLEGFAIQRIYDFEAGGYDFVSGIMAINYEALTKENNLERVIKHETYHLLQAAPEREGAEFGFGFSTNFEQEDVNALLYVWHFEGCAEQLVINHLGTDSTVYDYARSFIERIKTATLTDSSKSFSDFEELSLTNDLTRLYEYFGADTEEKRKEVLQLMFAIEVIVDLNYISPANSFLEKIPCDDWQFHEDNFMKGSIASSLSKLFYDNLTQLEGATLGDIFSLISIFEMGLNNSIRYIDNKNYHDNGFFEIYGTLQDGFFTVLGESTGIEKEKLICLCNDYNFYDMAKQESLSCLPEETAEFYKSMIDKTYLLKTISINEVIMWQKEHRG